MKALVEYKFPCCGTVVTREATSIDGRQQATFRADDLLLWLHNICSSHKCAKLRTKENPDGEYSKREVAANWTGDATVN